MKGPWRKVAVIEDSSGARGGGHWHLTLVCGHFEARRKPSNRPETAFRRTFQPVRTAPKRVRCRQCADDPKAQAEALSRALRSPPDDGGGYLA
jgi:hypothetical protein